MPIEQTQFNKNELADRSQPASRRLLDEIHDDSQQQKTCPKAIDDLQSLGEFAYGVVVGAANGAEGFIEFFATPEALNKGATRLATAAGGALATAGEYYYDKIANGKTADIGRDATTAGTAIGDWLTDYGNKDCFERGKITGRLAADFLAAEVGIAAVRSVGAAAMTTEGAAEVVALQSNSGAEFHQFVQRLVEAGDEATAEVRLLTPQEGFASHLDDVVQQLPQSLRDFMKENNIKVIALKEIGGMRPEFAGADGLFMQMEGQPNMCFLAENMHTAGDIVNVSKLELTLRHELAHAIDACSGKGGFFSDSPAVQKLFTEEFDALDAFSQSYLVDGVGLGSMERVVKEVVAELVSRSAVPGKGALDVFFPGSFPKLSKMLNEPGSPFRFE